MANISITEVTDPFCTWSWGAEPVLRRLEEQYRDQVELTYVMGGLVEDFDGFNDVSNGIRDPEDVASHWEVASERHGMPVDTDIWRENPPRSSYPSSIAYKAAEMQGTERAQSYLRRLREAIATERRDISRRYVLVELADEVGLDVDSFTEALSSGEAEAAFENDRQFVHQNRATAFPTFKIETDSDEIWLRGFQSFEALQEAVEQVAPGLETYDPRTIPEFVRQRGRVATQEVAEVYEMTPGRTIQALRSLDEEGILRAISVGNGYFWEHVSDRTNPKTGSRDVSDGKQVRDELGLGCNLDGECMIDSA